MTDDLASARADLAFLRTLAEGDPRPSASFGFLLAVAGLLYGMQVLIHWAGASGLVPIPDWLHLTVAVVATGGFLAVLSVVIWHDRNQPRGSFPRRAYETAFQAAGLMNLAMVFVFGFNAIKANDFTIWLYYVPVVFAIQGGAWFMAATLRKRFWYALVAGGWFVAAAVLGITMGTNLFNLVAGVSILLLMALPGLVMVRLARQAA